MSKLKPYYYREGGPLDDITEPELNDGSTV